MTLFRPFKKLMVKDVIFTSNYFSSKKIALNRDECEIGKIGKYNEPSFHFCLEKGDDLYLAASSIDKIRFSEIGIALYLFPIAVSRLIELLEFSDVFVDQYLLIELESSVDERLANQYCTNIDTLHKLLNGFKNEECVKHPYINKFYMHDQIGKPILDRQSPNMFKNLFFELGTSACTSNNVFSLLSKSSISHGSTITNQMDNCIRHSQDVNNSMSVDDQAMVEIRETSSTSRHSNGGKSAPLILKNRSPLLKVSGNKNSSDPPAIESEKPTIFNSFNKINLDEPRQIIEESDDDDTLLRYPTGSAGITVHFRDMGRLAYGEMLNDNTIEIGIRRIIYNLATKEYASSCHMFNTFFFATLTKDDQNINFRNENSRKPWVQRNYTKLKRWTRKVDLFSKNHIIIPINDDLHWCAIVIENPKGLLTQKDENKKADPCFYVMFDSIPESDDKRNNAISIIADYLELEFEDKKKKTCSNLEFNRENIMKVDHYNNPVQKNYIDCGIYMLSFLEKFITNPPENLKQNCYIDWSVYCPYFECVNIKYYREKLINFVKKRTSTKRWSRLERFEKLTCGVTNPSDASAAEAARKLRAHSCSIRDEYELSMKRLNRKYRKRCRSLVARFDELISTKPIVITRENGKAYGKY